MGDEEGGKLAAPPQRMHHGDWGINNARGSTVGSLLFLNCRMTAMELNTGGRGELWEGGDPKHSALCAKAGVGYHQRRMWRRGFHGLASGLRASGAGANVG